MRAPVIHLDEKRRSDLASSLEGSPALDRHLRGIIAGVTHELRAPITTLIMSAEALLTDFEKDLPEDAQTLMLRILHSASWLGITVDNLAISARPEADGSLLTWSEVDPRDCLETALTIVEPMLERRGQRVEVDFPADVVVWADRHRIDQILVNLLMNACKYGELETVIRVSLSRERYWVRIQVENTGPGIHPDERARIFECYVRGTAAEMMGRSGTGLGLHIVKTLVERHGGGVGVESTPGQGASFWFSLPIWPAAGGKVTSRSGDAKANR